MMPLLRPGFSRLRHTCARLSRWALTSVALVGAVVASPQRNLFHEYLGVSEAELDARLDHAWHVLFAGGRETDAIVYPVGDDMAYILDVFYKDVRTEGMSYGMMMAVQYDDQEMFNRLWKWARTYMYHDSGPFAGYFAWHCRPDGTQLDAGPASDGEEWFAVSLLLASGRWGDGEGIFDYRARANEILHTMRHKGEEGIGEPGVISMFAPEAKQIRFVPLKRLADVTDPSYHVPAFYELLAAWVDEDRAFWGEAAAASRQLFRDAAHPKTGLMPDYSGFDGEPVAIRGHENFLYDAHRTLGNVALDWAWFQADPWQQEQSNRVLGFLSQFRPDIPYSFTLDGEPLSEESSPSLTAMAAVAALAADREVGEPFVRDLWEAPVPDGKFRYYGGLLYMFALLEVGGRFDVYPPAGLEDPRP
ncbi:MAG: oligosaccharide reducing-end xylanase [Puniceicoccaceae bacterium 5H]|nr:MAG: oligosaccharide reducing-end xylanase [Puniceicoccaceae bacterium 5H]